MLPGIALTSLVAFRDALRIYARSLVGFAPVTLLGIGLVLFGAMLVLMAARVPIAIAMFVPGAIGYAALSVLT